MKKLTVFLLVIFCLSLISTVWAEGLTGSMRTRIEKLKSERTGAGLTIRNIKADTKAIKSSLKTSNIQPVGGDLDGVKPEKASNLKPVGGQIKAVKPLKAANISSAGRAMKPVKPLKIFNFTFGR